MRVKIVQSDEQLVSHSGLAVVGKILDNTRIRERLDKIELPGQGFTEISHGEIVATMLGLLCLGKPDFDAVEPFREDKFFARSLGLKKVPSSATLRQRLDSVKGAFNSIILDESAKMVRWLLLYLRQHRRGGIPDQPGSAFGKRPLPERDTRVPGEFTVPRPTGDRRASAGPHGLR